ncbi:MAG: hypothetical protein K1X81_07650 [Bacteroidia bacterium]|nr:hypothetical protein [Bacteroidia bacterium]
MEYKEEIKRLEIADKRIDIQKKKLEVKKEKSNHAQVMEQSQLRLDEKRLLIQKISELRFLLTDYVVDDERAIIGSEPFYKPTITGLNREKITLKLMDLIDQL